MRITMKNDDKDEVVQSPEKGRDQEAAEEYWTEERMRKAKPRSISRPPPKPSEHEKKDEPPIGKQVSKESTQSDKKEKNNDNEQR